MQYINNFSFPSVSDEEDFIMSIRRTCYNSFYPFKILSPHNLQHIEFEPITILYGGNGSGKTTALNIIAEKIKIKRSSVFNTSNFFSDYLQMCSFQLDEKIPKTSKIITSDDVFDYMLNIRSLNDGIHQQREELFQEYLDAKYSKFQLHSLDDYDQLKKVTKTRSKTQSQFVRSELMDNVRTFSNGESAYKYFTEKIDENALYILDEPENSLAPKLQMDFAQFIEESARFFKCQFIISTHSPFLLALQGAKIYDLDSESGVVTKWTQLENVRSYYDFFKLHENEF
jgi:predicted ATPase